MKYKKFITTIIYTDLNKNKRTLILRAASILCVFFGIISCHNENYYKNNVLFLGHAYQWGYPNKVDQRIEKLLTKYKFGEIWLGGDVCAHTTADESTLKYLDSIVGISKNTTLWALGNHDVMDRGDSLISKYTNRPSFYTYNHNNDIIMVLNTNFLLFDCSNASQADKNNLEKQYEMIKNVTDTIKNKNNLIILHHHSLVTEKITNNKYNIRNIFNLYQPDLQFSCEMNANFESLIYPKFVEVRKKGINVCFIGGDIGARGKKFSYIDNNGIIFLGSGINNTCPKVNPPKYVTNFSPDSILILNIDNKNITWEFKDLDEMIK